MSIPEILGLLVLASGAWFVWDSLKVREAANVAMRAACRMEGLLFLDDTVALESVWPVRNDEGHLTLRRIYCLRVQRHGRHAAQGPRRDASGRRVVAEHRIAGAAGGSYVPLNAGDRGNAFWAMLHSSANNGESGLA